jgi:hypothetical protein
MTDPRDPRQRAADELELACLRAFIAGMRWLSPRDFQRYKRLEERERENALLDKILSTVKGPQL